MKFVLFKCKIQEICKRAVERYPRLLDSVPDEYINQEMCEGEVSKRQIESRYLYHSAFLDGLSIYQR